jgi:hypothetical protein
MGFTGSITALSLSNYEGLRASWVDDNPDDNPGSMQYHLMGQAGMKEQRSANKINHPGIRWYWMERRSWNVPY